MCDPLTIASLALTAGSVAANTIASNQDAAARNTVLSNETVRNQQLEQQAQAVNQHAQAQFENFGGQQDQRAQSLGDYFGTPGEANISSGTVLPASTSDIVNQDQAKQMAAEKAYVGGQADALGKVKSFGDLLGDLSVGQARDAQAVGQIGNNETGYATRVLPYQLDASTHSGDTARLIGDLLAGAGSVTSGIGAMKNPTALSSLFNTLTPKVSGGANALATGGVTLGGGSTMGLGL